MMLAQTTARFKKAVRALTTEEIDDERFDRIRERAGLILDQFADDPLNTDLIEKCREVVVDLESLNEDLMTELNYQRSQTNVVVVSALSRRTHYAAYLAGKWSTDEQLGGRFKTWMHNAAAHGAITLYESVNALVGTNYEESFDRGLLKIFGDGALCDAHRFLFVAEGFFPDCALTQYNKAKLDIFERTPEAVERGIKLLKSLSPPQEDCHPAEVSWHLDNLDEFKHRDKLLQKIVSIEHPDELIRIEQILQANAGVASKIASERGKDLWKAQNRRAKAVLTAMSSGTIITLYATIALSSLLSASTLDVKNLLADHSAIVRSAYEGEDEVERERGGIDPNTVAGAGGLKEGLEIGAGGLEYGAGGLSAEDDVVRCVFGRGDILA